MPDAAIRPNWSRECASPPTVRRGWKIGWCVAASPLTEAVRASHQFLNFSVATPLQAGAATALALPDSYFDGLLEDYRRRRDLLVEGLDNPVLRVLEALGMTEELAPLLLAHDLLHVETIAHIDVTLLMSTLGVSLGKAARLHRAAKESAAGPAYAARQEL